MKKNLEAQHKELEDKRRVFEEERANWETHQRLQQQQMEATRYSTHTGAQIMYICVIIVTPCGSALCKVCACITHCRVGE